jgi:hypothetical protein
MRNGYCCQQNSNVAVAGRSWTRAARRAVSWIVPSIVLAAMPKCPLCLAAYVALFTGFGISLAAATFAWWLVAAGCIGVLAYLAMNAVRSMLKLR